MSERVKALNHVKRGYFSVKSGVTWRAKPNDLKWLRVVVVMPVNILITAVAARLFYKYATFNGIANNLTGLNLYVVLGAVFFYMFFICVLPCPRSSKNLLPVNNIMPSSMVPNFNLIPPVSGAHLNNNLGPVPFVIAGSPLRATNTTPFICALIWIGFKSSALPTFF